MKVDINSYVSLKKVTNLFDMLDAKGFKTMGRMMYEQYNMYAKPLPLPAYVTKDATADTDWQDEVFRTGYSQSHNVSVRGGSENTQFSISANIYDEQGVVLDNKYLMQNARMKVDTKNLFLIFQQV